MEKQNSTNVPTKDCGNSNIKSSQVSSHPPYKSGLIKITIGNKTVGIVSKGVFIKNLHSTRHFLRKPPAIAFDEESIEKVTKLGVISIKILDLDTGKTYTASIDLVKEKGIRLDRGYGPQIALPLQYWKCVEKLDNKGNFPRRSE